MAFVFATEATRKVRLAAWVFTLTISLSASLLFFVQPLFAKIVLPAIGGSPAVWATAMLFFQTVLLSGYLYAHFSARYLALPQQVGLHLAIWAVALFFLPPALPEGWQLDAARPITGQTLWLFALGVGVPFALLSSNAPLIQSWFARSGSPSADDPYFLYSASNFGSVIALLSFPLLVEPMFGASDISTGFSYGFVLLGVGLAGCGVFLFGKVRHMPSAAASHEPAPILSTIVYWGVLGFVPSSLMLAVTTKVSIDIGAVPLIWVIPLTLYLVSFVIAFRPRSPIAGTWFTRSAQLVSVVALCLMVGVAGDHLSPSTMGLLILCFFVIATWAHRQLYEARPHASHLTVYYVVMSIGGALGGVFNSILGPLLFTDHVEGTATLIVMLLLVFAKTLGIDARSVRQGAIIGVPVGLVAAGAALFAGGGPVILGGAIVAGLVLLAMARRTLPVMSVAASIAIAVPVWLAAPAEKIFADRSFFGLHQVIERDGLRLYANGTTVHGAQRISDLGADRPTPLSYYHPATPMGQVMRSDLGQMSQRVGIVGLGVGSLSCYATPLQDWHFYEIDAMVDRVARDPELFTFLSSCTPDAPTHLGDARVVLEEQDSFLFDIVVIDAYSSNAIPVHLTTLEAMQLYLDRLAPGGVLLFHISNRYYDIGLPIARSVDALNVHAWRQVSSASASDEPGYSVSDVVMIARDPADVAELLASGNWDELDSDGGQVWTDDKADPLSILKPGALWQ